MRTPTASSEDSMTFRTIAVELDPGAHAMERLDAAVALAERFDAHLHGLYSDFTLDPRFYYQADVRHRYALTLQELSRERREHAEQLFRDRLASSKLRHDWLPHGLTGRSPLIEHARCADLTIVGQHDPREHDGYLADRFPERTIMSAGGPVLVWPRDDAAVPLDATTVIAWNGSREAARATFDALPLLRCSRRVEIVSVRAGRVARLAHERAAPDLAQSLIRHEVNVNAIELAVTDDADVGAAIMSHVESVRARLLVMGAFHHGRLYEAVLGGMTRTALREARLPVLMSS
jgi:nucleotide-binding universal stress UspA family protein